MIQKGEGGWEEKQCTRAESIGGRKTVLIVSNKEKIPMKIRDNDNVIICNDHFYLPWSIYKTLVCQLRPWKSFLCKLKLHSNAA